jgi:hypothetical protein
MQQLGRCSRHDQHLTMAGIQEALVLCMVEEPEQIIEIPVDIQQPAGPGMKLQLPPGDDLDEFLQRAETTRQCNEAVRQHGHQ